MKLTTELDFLTLVERGEVVTQMTLRQKIGVSIGLINALLKRAVNKGYIKVKKAPYKRYAYYLTPQGFKEKSRLVAAYLETSLDFLRMARGQYSDILDQAQKDERTSIVFAGAGELTEIAILATLGRDLKSLRILCPESSLSSISGVQIIKTLPDDGNSDLIIITDSVNPQDTYEKLREQYPEKTIVWPPFLRITPDRIILLEAAE